MKIEIFDPAMCCSTGVCGPIVDPELVRIQEMLRQIQKQAPEVQVSRYGLSADPEKDIYPRQGGKSLCSGKIFSIHL